MQISLIIPSYGRPLAIRHCLRSLLNQTLPRDAFEVLVVDDGSPVPLQMLEAEFPGLNLRVIRQQNAGPGMARNRGAAEARARYLAFTDDDCLPAPDWLETYVRAMDRDPSAIWGGPISAAPGESIYSRVAQSVVDIVYAYFNRDPDRCQFFCSNNIAMTSAIFKLMDGFSDQFRGVGAEDRDFCERSQMVGINCRYLSTARIAHRPGLTLARFFGMYLAYGRGAFRYQRLRLQRRSGSIQSDIGFHLLLPYHGLKLAPAYRPHEWPAVLLLLLLWQISNALGFFLEARTFNDNGGATRLPLLPPSLNDKGGLLASPEPPPPFNR